MPELMEKYKRQVAERDRLRQRAKVAMATTDWLVKQDGGNGEKQDGGNEEKQDGENETKQVGGENGVKKDGGKQDGVEPSSGDSNEGGKVDLKVDPKRHVVPRKKFTWSFSTRCVLASCFYMQTTFIFRLLFMGDKCW